MPKFIKPADVKQFWVASCCFPGHADPAADCNFCDRSARDCAEELSEYAAGGPFPPGSDPCGGSGFWCKGCGRFWAQDTCGNNDGTSWEATDGKDIIASNCVCGKALRLPNADQP